MKIGGQDYDHENAIRITKEMGENITRYHPSEGVNEYSS